MGEIGEFTKEKCRAAALSVLNYSMRTESELRKKLADKGFGEAEIDDAVSYVKEYGYVDDVKYGMLYIGYARGKGYGIRRIKDELRKRGVSSFDIEDAFYGYEKQLDDDGEELIPERERALEAALKACGDKEIDDKLIAKTGRKLKTLGYDSDAIYYALGRLMNK